MLSKGLLVSSAATLAATTSSSCLCDAFFIGSSSMGSSRSIETCTSSSLSPLHAFLTPHEALDLVSSQQAAAHDMLHHSSLLLADAADAVADTAAAAASSDDGGWWQTYLNFFKASLMFVHTSIDEPLRSVGISNTWGPTIALFTAGVRASLLPLSIQQTKAAEYQKALKPYQDEIKEKFKDNQDMMNRAIAKLYEDAGTNPLSGCLISLAQLPVFIGLYRSITLLAKEGNLQEPFLWIPSLEGPVSPPDYRGMEWLTQNWVDNHPAMGWQTTLAFLVMPVILVIGQSLTMKALSPEQDTDNMTPEEKETFERSNGVLKFLPLMIGYFSLQVPAGLTIYWFMSNVVTLSQSLAIKSYYKANPPEINLPDYWDALEDVDTMSPEEKRKAAEAGIATGPKFEDLLEEAKFHYIVERQPLRRDSQAWNRVGQESGLMVPLELQDWVSMQSDGHDKEDAVEKKEAAAAAATAA